MFELADATAAHAAKVKAAVAEADRIAAEKAKAAAAAAAKAAAAAAAAAEASRARIPPLVVPHGSGESDRRTGDRPRHARGTRVGRDQFGCLVSLWDRESGWNVYAQNPSSGAYGIPQALPGSKMGTAGSDWQTNAATQIAWGLGYIADRYGSPCGAWSHSESAGWY